MLNNPFPPTATTDQVLDGLDLEGRSVLITGGGGGLGAEMTRALCKAGAAVTITARDVASATRIVEEIHREAARTKPVVVPLDLTSPKSIATLTESWHGPLDVLIANAGIMVPPETLSETGWESQFATNFLGHFALTAKLRSALANSLDARVLLASSNAHLLAPIDLDDLNFDRRPYEPWTAYSQSKTALILFAVGGAERWSDDGITLNAYNPGFVRTGLQRHMPASLRNGAQGARTATEGAATATYLASSPLVSGVSGRYFENIAEAEPAGDAARDMSDPDTFRGVAGYALDKDAASRLWSIATNAVEGWY